MMDLLAEEHEQMAGFLKNHSKFMEARHDIRLLRQNNRGEGKKHDAG